MKIKSIVTTLLYTVLMTGAISCSDKKDEPAVPDAKSIAGTYHGDMKCSVMGSESVFEDMSISITATDDSDVTVSIGSFGEPPMQVPQFDVTDVAVSGSDGLYNLASTEFEGTTETGRIYSGTLQGSYKDEVLTIIFNLNYGSMPMPMICSFSATGN